MAMVMAETGEKGRAGGKVVTITAKWYAKRLPCIYIGEAARNPMLND
jgi:hypothetical protein